MINEEEEEDDDDDDDDALVLAAMYSCFILFGPGSEVGKGVPASAGN